jgi:anti-sigma-K factor RskA
MNPVEPDRTDRRDDEHPHDDDLAAFAVDAVEEPERSEIAAHLAACPPCRHSLADHQETLARMIDDEGPPAAVWDRISEETGPARPAEPAVPATAPPPPVPQPSTAPAPAAAGPPTAPVSRLDGGRHLPPAAAGRRRQRHASPNQRRLAGVLAAAAAVVVAVSIGPALWDRAADDDPSTEIVAPRLPVGVLAAPDGTEIARVGADAEGSYVELLEPMDALPAGRSYQMGSLDGPAPVSLGVLGPGTDPVARVTVPEGTTSVAISVEPAGGSPAPTGAIAGTGELDLSA